MSENNNKNEIPIHFPDHMKAGVYANGMVMAHTPEEFIIDFLSVMPPAGTVVSRIVVSPAHAKRIADVMAQNIQKYEREHGAIPDTPGPGAPKSNVN